MLPNDLRVGDIMLLGFLSLVIFSWRCPRRFSFSSGFMLDSSSKIPSFAKWMLRFCDLSKISKCSSDFTLSRVVLFRSFFYSISFAASSRFFASRKMMRRPFISRSNSLTPENTSWMLLPCLFFKNYALYSSDFTINLIATLLS